MGASVVDSLGTSVVDSLGAAEIWVEYPFLEKVSDYGANLV